MVKQRSVLGVLLLSIITCGVYILYWIYAVRVEQREVLRDNSINPLMDLLLSLICGVYLIYLLYVMAQDATRIEEACGCAYKSDNSIASLLLSVFGFALISILIIQNQLNNAYKTGTLVEVE